MNRSYSKWDSFPRDFHGAIAAAYQIEGAWNEGAKDFRSGIPILKLSATPLKKQEEFAIDRSLT